MLCNRDFFLINRVFAFKICHLALIIVFLCLQYYRNMLQHTYHDLSTGSVWAIVRLSRPKNKDLSKIGHFGDHVEAPGVPDGSNRSKYVFKRSELSIGSFWAIVRPYRRYPFSDIQLFPTYKNFVKIHTVFMWKKFVFSSNLFKVKKFDFKSY